MNVKEIAYKKLFPKDNIWLVSVVILDDYDQVWELDEDHDLTCDGEYIACGVDTITDMLIIMEDVGGVGMDIELTEVEDYSIE